MCLTIFLLANRSLPVPPDAAKYPSLRLDPVVAPDQADTFAGIQQIAPAPFIYGVSPGGYCGCYFQYDTSEEFQSHLTERAANPEAQYAGTPEEAETMWRCQANAVNSFGRYLATHSNAELAVYVVWEHCAGQKVPTRQVVPPSYFGGAGFGRLPEDVLLTIGPELVAGETPPWPPGDQRTHEWIDINHECESGDA